MIFKKISYSFICVLFASIFITSCSDSVFYSVRHEVALEDAAINGFVNSIVRFTDSDGKEWLYLQNGNLYYKQISDDTDFSKLTKNMSNKTWTKDESENTKGLSYSYADQEFSGWHFYKLASDQNYIYALAFQAFFNEDYSRNEPRRIKLFCTNGIASGWKEVPAINEAIEKYINNLDDELFMMDSSIHLFGTNAPKKEHREAFIRIGGGNAYTYSGSSESEKRVNYERNYGNTEFGNYGIIKLDGENTTIDIIKAGEKGATYRTLSAYYANGEVHFANNIAVSTDETKASDAKYVYYGDGRTLKSFSVDTLTSEGTTKVFMPNRDGNLVDDANFTVESVDILDAYINGLAIDTNNKKATLTNENKIISSSGSAGTILSLAVTNDSILLGTYEEGVYRVLKNSATGEPATSTSNFETNASNVMSDYIIRMVFCTDPSVNEVAENSALCSSMQFRYTENQASKDYDNVGLWSYYYNRTSDPLKNWNRE